MTNAIDARVALLRSLWVRACVCGGALSPVVVVVVERSRAFVITGERRAARAAAGVAPSPALSSLIYAQRARPERTCVY